MTNYWDRFDNDALGEERVVLPFPKARRLELVREEAPSGEAWQKRAAQIQAEEEVLAEARQNELDAAVQFLKWLVSEGEYGNNPGKVLAAARAGRLA